MTSAPNSLEELRRRFEADEVQGIWEWLLTHFIAFARHRFGGRYNPRVYSPSGVWDDVGCTDLANDFIVKRGIEKGAIARALLTADDLPGCMAYLERSFQQFVISERPRSMSRNIYDRLRDLLDEHPEFLRLGGVPPHSLYGLADWEDDPPSPVTEEQMASAGRFLPVDVVLVTYRSSTRESPGISSVDLVRVVRQLLGGLERCMTARQIMSVLQNRYPLDDGSSVDNISLYAESLAAPKVDPLEAGEADELAVRAWGTLTDRQKRILELMLLEPLEVSARRVAERLNLKKSTAALELRAIRNQFVLLGARTDEMQGQILDALRVRLSRAS